MTQTGGPLAMKRLAGFFIPLVLTCSSAGLYLALTEPSKDLPAPSVSAPRVTIGKDYYLSVAMFDVLVLALIVVAMKRLPGDRKRKLVPEVVARELRSQSLSIDLAVAQRALNNSMLAWSKVS